jgi:hypothetical protein
VTGAYHNLDTENYVARSTETSMNFAGQYSLTVPIVIIRAVYFIAHVYTAVV